MVLEGEHQNAVKAGRDQTMTIHVGLFDYSLRTYPSSSHVFVTKNIDGVGFTYHPGKVTKQAFFLMTGVFNTLVLSKPNPN